MRTLRALIEIEAPMRPARAIEITQRVLDALHAMHESGRVHGDVRAERVMLDAMRTQLLPAENHHADASKTRDVSAVASILYELLTRASPDHEGPASHHNPSVLPERLVAIVDRVRHGEVESALTFKQDLRVCLIDALSQARGRRST